MIYAPNNTELTTVGVHRSNAFLPSKVASESLEFRLNGLYPAEGGMNAARELNFDNPKFNEQVEKCLMLVQQLYWSLSLGDATLNYDDAVKEINEFKRQFLFLGGESKFQRYRNLQMGRLYFSHVKDSLEKVTCLLTQEKENGFEQKAKNGIKDLIKYLGSCAPGVMADLDDLVLQLSNNKNIIFWLSKLRSDIINTYASIEISRSHVRELWEVHVHTLINVLAHQIGYQPPKPNIYDYHVSQLSITSAGVVSFRNYFTQAYSAKNIVSVLSDNISDMVESLHYKYTPDGDGWMQCMLNYENIIGEIESIVRALDTGVRYPGSDNTPQAPNLDSFCELSDDCSKIRIRYRETNEIKQFLIDTLLEQGIFTKHSDYTFKGTIGVRAEIGVLPEMTDREMALKFQQNRADDFVCYQMNIPVINEDACIFS